MDRDEATLSFGIFDPLAAREPLATASPAIPRYRHSPAVHGGPGALDYMALLDSHALDTNLYFLHRGVIEPKSGIGAHFHNQCEEMFVILDGEAQFTIDGRTSLIKGPAGAPCRMGHSHGIYNADRQAGPVDEHQCLGGEGQLRRVQPERRPRGRATRPDSGFYVDAARPRAVAKRDGDERRHGSRAIPPRAGSVGFSWAVGLRRSPCAASGHLDRPAPASRSGRGLLRDEGIGNDCGRRRSAVAAPLRKWPRSRKATPSPFS